MAITNIFATVSAWDSGKTYGKWDVVKHNSRIWYSLEASNLNNTPSLSSTQWGGNRTWVTGDVKPRFLWTFSYGGTANFQPNVISIRFGSSYEQRIKEGVNNNLINLEVTFNNREDAEIAAILHFLSQREGTESFIISLPKPFQADKLFKCPNWNMGFEFFNNKNIRLNFIEVPT